MDSARTTILRELHERIGVGDGPEVDRLVLALAQHPTTGDGVNALIHRLYDRLGGLPNQDHSACPACTHTAEPETRPTRHAHAHVTCLEGGTSSPWTLVCQFVSGKTFTVTGATYEAVLRAALVHAEEAS